MDSVGNGPEDGSMWVLWDAVTNRLVHLRYECVVRRGVKRYRISDMQWQKMVSNADHVVFDYNVAYKYWKQNFSTVCVVVWPAEVGGNEIDSYVWCVRLELDNTLSSSAGGNVLWPIPTERACSLYMSWQEDQHASQSSLMLYPPSYPRLFSKGWLANPYASVASNIQLFETRIFLASVQPCTFSHDARVQGGPDTCSAARQRAQAAYMTLPSSYLGTQCFPSKKRPKSRIRFFDRLPLELVDTLVGNIANDYVNTPHPGACRGWYALRSVSVAFREASDDAAIFLMSRVHSAIRFVEDFDEVSHIDHLRTIVLPTGLDLWHLLKAYKAGTLSGYDQRTALLAYMRAHTLKEHNATLPPRVRHPTELVPMVYVHSKQPERECQERGVVHATRSKDTLYPRWRWCVHMRLLSEAWRAQSLKSAGWSEVADSCRG